MGIVIKHKNGEKVAERIFASRAEQTSALLSEDTIKMDIASEKPIDFCIGDYIDYCGKTYTLNQLPSAKKNNARLFTYSANFEGEQYELMDLAWILPVNTYGDSFTGNLLDFLEILMDNVSRCDRTWRLGAYPEQTEIKTLTYTQTNCLAVLQGLCKEYGVEFDIVREGANRILNIRDKVGGEFATHFEYGRTGGAYNIERRTSNGKNIITKLFVFGADKNLPSTYRENKLCLPNKTRNESYITDEEASAMYGNKENVKYFTDIFPCRYGKVSAIDANKNVFFDSSMDFDINEKKENGDTKWLINGATAKIQFTSGNLAGYSFDVLEYNHAQKKFRIKTYTDPNGLNFPNADSAAYQIKVDDDYFISDIRVPDSYVSAAENKLLAEGQKWFDENCKPQVEYSIDLDSFFLKNIYGVEGATAEIFRPGMLIRVIDADLEMEKTLRVASFTRDLLNPYHFKINIAEKVQITTTAQRIISELSEVKEVIRINDLQDSAKAKRNWQTTQDVLGAVFDPEGQYFSEKIKPLSIETSMLAVGARSQQFTLKGVSIDTNYSGDPNSVHSSAGVLEHYTISDEGTKVWQISESEQSDMDADKVYYVYAKCSRADDTATMYFDYEQHTTDSDPDFFYFLCGTLTSVTLDGNNERPARQAAMTYGSTSVNGRYVNTGRIQSQDGRVWMDLDNGEIGGNIDFQDSVITETILIKNGKSEDGQTQYCGAISGNTNYPVMWVSDQSTTDADAVKDLANGDCPVKISKAGIGSNFGCLNITSASTADVKNADGVTRISANDINKENSEIGNIGIVSDVACHVNIPANNKVAIAQGGKKEMVWNIYETPIKIYDGQRKKITMSEISASIFSMPIQFDIEKVGLTDTITYRITVKVEVIFKVGNAIGDVSEYKSWADTYYIDDTIGSGSRAQTRKINVSLPLSGIKNIEVNVDKWYVTGQVIITTAFTNSGTGFMVYQTNDSYRCVLPTLHFKTQSSANILAVGGYTCSLDSDNYFKLYPDTNNKLVSDMKLKCVLQTFNLSSNGGNNYVSGWRWGAVVFIKYKIVYGYAETSALTIPSGFRPVSNFDAITYGNKYVEYRTTGVIHPYNLNSGETLWGGVTYLTNQ